MRESDYRGLVAFLVNTAASLRHVDLDALREAQKTLPVDDDDVRLVQAMRIARNVALRMRGE